MTSYAVLQNCNTNNKVLIILFKNTSDIRKIDNLAVWICHKCDECYLRPGALPGDKESYCKMFPKYFVVLHYGLNIIY